MTSQMHGRDGSGRSDDRGGKSEEPLLVFGSGPGRVGRDVGVLGLCGQVPVPAFLREGSRVQNVPARPSGFSLFFSLCSRLRMFKIFFGLLNCFILISFYIKII